ncbi:FeoA family protein [Nostoc sp. CALU 546]|uniref:FeoA family protein n=1 Tax=Nostoc sp. CALU 546 TaxID=1867241 RepID=UPI003B673F0F
MFTAEKFTVFGSSLSLLKPGEQGVITKVESTDETIVQKLKAMGVVRGTAVVRKQRSPVYTFVQRGDRLILCQKTASAIYVRLA